MLIFCLTFVVFCSDTGNTTLENGSGQVKWKRKKRINTGFKNTFILGLNESYFFLAILHLLYKECLRS